MAAKRKPNSPPRTNVTISIPIPLRDQLLKIATQEVPSWRKANCADAIRFLLSQHNQPKRKRR